MVAEMTDSDSRDPLKPRADLPGWLAERLAKPTPGRNAQRRLEPEGSEGRHFIPRDDAKAASVLILLYPRQGEWLLPLTLRPDHLPDHPGQISFPGGAREPNETSDQAAVRELQEELGVSTDGVRLLGRLSPLYVFVSNYLIDPWVGVVDSRPTWSPCPIEVQEVIEFPLRALMEPSNIREERRELAGQSRGVPYFAHESHRIWGA
ncbi:MAG: CoA pyrophosphatase, partial [Planctomycetales bacterium]